MGDADETYQAMERFKVEEAAEGESDAADELMEADDDIVCGRFPKAVPFLIGQEFCERFSYYGLRAILVLYFTNFFGFTDSRATVFYHLFIMLSYLTSVFGGILADSSLGKYRTILYLSIVYCLGNIVMSFTAIPSVAGDPPQWAGAMIGLLLIAVGTGGIKPCVAAFGGDQFTASQQHLLQTFFAAFYFSINAGSTLSMIITPKLRADVHCYGQDECYPLAFGVPAILMGMATIVFVLGRRRYREHVPDRNVILDVIRAMKMSLAHKFSRDKKKGGSPTTHWLDPARAKYGDAFINDIRQVLSVFVVFIPAPLFWTLFDQQGSRWTLQAEQMRMFNMGPLGRFRPDQMQAANAIMVLLLIPVFERIIYPTLKKFRIPHSPLQRMFAGMALCGLAFVISGLVQVRIDAAKPDLRTPANHATLRVASFVDGPVRVIVSKTGTAEPILLNTTLILGPGGFGASPFTRLAVTAVDVSITSSADAGLLPLTIQNLTLASSVRHTLNVFVDNSTSQLSTLLVENWNDRHTPDPNDEDSASTEVAEDDARLKVVNLTPLELRLTSASSPSAVIIDHVDALHATTYTQAVFDSGDVALLFQQLDNVTVIANLTHLAVALEDGADYSASVLWNGTHASVALLNDVPANSVPITLQLPQYLVMTCGEILFSITGLEFAFSEAPTSMKAVVQAGWLLTVTIGSLIVIIVAESSFFDAQRDEFFFFAAMMGAVCLLFIYLAKSYRYRNPLHREKTSLDSKDTTPLIPEEHDLDSSYA
eukprot:m.30035 g.30035  ORF g.30035 m.30035 type:complete len:766 (-) comp10570_c0_seq1:216-2513(-)